MLADTSPAPLLLAHSLPAFGGAGLPVMLAILGTRACALPTLVLNATANHPGVRRWSLPIVEQLDASLSLHRMRGARPDLFIGYLADARQAKQIATWLAANRSSLGLIYADPICGDNGRAYVAAELIAAWGDLLAYTDIAFPNLTEWTLLAHAAGAHDPASWWRRGRMPRCVIVTSSSDGTAYGNRMWESGRETFVAAQHIPADFHGTGDVFAACCLRALGEGLNLGAAVHRASRQTENIIRESIALGSTTLQISPNLAD